MKLDETDKRILELLTINGRMSYVDIGKELGLSRVAIRERVNQLIEKGIIEKFSVVINSEKVGNRKRWISVQLPPRAFARRKLRAARTAHATLFAHS